MTICKQDTTVCSVSEWHFPDLKKNKEGKTVVNILKFLPSIFQSKYWPVKDWGEKQKGKKRRKRDGGGEVGWKSVSDAGTHKGKIMKFWSALYPCAFNNLKTNKQKNNEKAEKCCMNEGAN